MTRWMEVLKQKEREGEVWPEDVKNLVQALQPFEEETQDRMMGALLEAENEEKRVGALFRAYGMAGRLVSADELQRSQLPEQVWVVEGLLPVGLAILAGAPKVGKSWLALQVAREVGTGGRLLGREAQAGKVLYMALEDPPRRLQERIHQQQWPEGAQVDFLPMADFFELVGDLRDGGAGRLGKLIAQHGYRLVVIDTLSRAVRGDQNDVGEMTAWLAPLQRTAHECGCAILMIDHHRKPGPFNADAITDILGSTAKGATADTVLGLYRVRGMNGARLAVTGRETEQQELRLEMDWERGCWQMQRGEERPLTKGLEQVWLALAELGEAGPSELERRLGRNRGHILQQLEALERRGLAERGERGWRAVRAEEE